MEESKNKSEGPSGSQQDETVYMIFRTGLFLVGELQGGNKLLLPRVFSVIENGARIQMTPLPGVPAFLTLGNDGFQYPVPKSDKVIYDLYYRVTHPEEFVPDPIDISGEEEKGKIIRVK